MIDTSALVAILLNEPERRAFDEKIEADLTRLLSAVSFVEAATVIESRSGERGGREFDAFLRHAAIDIVAVDRDQAALARDAYRLYGRGRHTAGLNLGDCFAYALAKATGEPLLFKGGDFARTDVTPA